MFVLNHKENQLAFSKEEDERQEEARERGRKHMDSIKNADIYRLLEMR